MIAALPTPTDEIARLRAALREIADAGCGLCEGDEPPCSDRWPYDRGVWCRQCIAREALGWESDRRSSRNPAR